ncbi:M48 family metallopeptidase [Aliiroseovarius crassostreae]|uniref:M48 family metallopeptidase n=1 Tax=Aliiroseovarius crassostreae TaxID=154981 RepID=UPI0021F9BA3D|nr:SprT family zinc-dependent metalloprotease [Aliiroseovarius crassostreae]UWP97801.1 M48 family metallopeptidase [Aliiroseovarius crassostreae]
MTNTKTIEVAGLAVELVRKNIKNLHIGVYPPAGHVRVAAPPSIGDDAVRVAVLTKLSWVKAKQLEFANQEREAIRRYVSGETHFVFGNARRLQVNSGDARRHRIELPPGDRLVFSVPKDSNQIQRAAWLEGWYRTELKEKVKPRIEKWVQRLGVAVPRWGVRRMKTKWGSCNPEKSIIWVNSELAKKPLICLDYVILHEMAHFISPRHDEEFIRVLDLHMPNWRQIRSDLNALPLSFEASFEI